LTADKITAGTIGAQTIQLSGINSIIQSSNYSAGTLGWKIDGSGTAEFNNLTVRTALDIGGNDNTSFHVDINGNMWLGAGISNYSSAPFRVSNAGLFYAGNVAATKYIQWNGTDLITTGQVVSNATQTGGTIGGVKVGTTSIYLGVGTYANANTPFYVDTSNQFSLGNKLTWNGSTLSIDGTVTIGGTAGSTIVSGATAGSTATQPGQVQNHIGGTNVTTITGGKVKTGIIQSEGFAENNPVDNFSSTGTQINLDNGVIKAKQFGIDSSGNAYFKGNITGASGTFSGALSGATGSFSGSLSGANITGATGTFSGSLSGATITGGTIKIGIIPFTDPVWYYLNIDSSGNINTTGSASFGGTVSVTGSMSARNITLDNDYAVRAVLVGQTAFATSGSSITARIHTLDSQNVKRITEPTSLRRFKENIEDLNEGLSTISKLRPRKFNWRNNGMDPFTNEPWTEEAKILLEMDKSYGFIVEEVLETNPELVAFVRPTNENEVFDLSKWEPVMYKEMHLLPILVKAVQELCDRIEYLESKIN